MSPQSVIRVYNNILLQDTIFLLLAWMENLKTSMHIGSVLVNVI